MAIHIAMILFSNFEIADSYTLGYLTGRIIILLLFLVTYFIIKNKRKRRTK